MATEIFHASRFSRGNFLFPTAIEVSDKAVTRRKRSWFGEDDMSMSIAKVASVRLRKGMIWADITIESSGGTESMVSHGHSKDDAERIQQLIEHAQAELAREVRREE